MGNLTVLKFQITYYLDKLYTWSRETNTPESVAREALLIKHRIGDYNNGSEDFKYEQ